MTLGTLEPLVTSIIQDLQNAATTVEGNGSIVIGGATSQLSGLLNQLKAMIGENFTKPINQLSREIRNTSNQLYSAVNRLDAILKNQQACLLVNAQVFLAGVQTIVSGVKSGLPFVKDDAPRIDYFQFEGHTPSVVPTGGGRISIVGFDLWHDEKYPPEVTLFAEDRQHALLKVQPQKAQDINSFSFTMTADFIAQHQGQNLQLQVIPKEERWISFFGAKTLGSFFMPICIPTIAFSKFSIVGHLQYTAETNVVTTLDFRRFGMGNSSCEDRKSYSQTQAWPMPENAQIINIVTKDPDVVNQNNIQFSFVNNTITAAGWLDSATCVNLLLGRKLVHDSHWFFSAAPQISYKQDAPKTADTTSDWLAMVNNTVDFRLAFPKSADSVAGDIFWFEILLQNGNAQKTVFSSPKINTSTFSTQVNGLYVDATYNDQIVNGQSELALKISLPNCGF